MKGRTVKRKYICSSALYMFFSTLYVLQHVICSSVRYMFFSTLYVLQHVICSSVLYMFFRTLDVLQYVICSSARYMFFSKLYVLQHVICSSARYIFFSTLYGLLSLLKRAPNFSQYTELPRKDEIVKTTQKDRTLKEYDDLKLDFLFLHSIVYLDGLLIMVYRNNTVLADRNSECKKMDLTNSVQSSLKSHPFWVSL